MTNVTENFQFALERVENMRKEENAGLYKLVFLFFPRKFCTLPKTNFNLLVRFILSSAKSFSLDWSKILLFVKELTLSQTSPCFYVSALYVF